MYRVIYESNEFQLNSDQIIERLVAGSLQPKDASSFRCSDCKNIAWYNQGNDQIAPHFYVRHGDKCIFRTVYGYVENGVEKSLSLRSSSTPLVLPGGFFDDDDVVTTKSSGSGGVTTAEPETERSGAVKLLMYLHLFNRGLCSDRAILRRGGPLRLSDISFASNLSREELHALPKGQFIFAYVSGVSNGEKRDFYTTKTRTNPTTVFISPGQSHATNFKSLRESHPDGVKAMLFKVGKCAENGIYPESAWNKKRHKYEEKTFGATLLVKQKE